MALSIANPFQYLTYADDIALLAKSNKDISKSFIELEDASLQAGLEVNNQKTKYMTIEIEITTGEDIKIRNQTFEKVNQFKYLGSLLNERNELIIEIKERISAGNRAYFSSQKILKNKNITRETKKTLYKTVIRPAVTYASETWTLTKTAENLLNTWERKVLRKIYGPTKD